MSKFLTAAFCLLATSFVVPSLISTTSAMAHDGGHGGGGGGGDHGEDFGGGDHGSFGSGDRGGFVERNDGIDVGHFDRTGSIANHFDRGDRFRRPGFYSDDFGFRDECYPEWAYKGQQHPFRSDVCPD